MYTKNMQYALKLPEAKLKLYYNKKVYSPVYSAIDTIIIADQIIKAAGKSRMKVLDVGCGTGVIGLGIKKLNPQIRLTLCDVDKNAVKVAKLNSKRSGLSAEVLQANLLPEGEWAMICANLPTYSKEEMEQELHGPDIAYFSDKPLGLYDQLFAQVKDRCLFLVCECQKKHQQEFLKLAERHGYILVLKTDYGFAFTTE